MKTKITILSILAGLSTLLLCSYKTGPGTHGCSANCHGNSASSSIALTLELDSAGVSVTHYVPGFTYSVKISGTNNSGSNLPYFGFQLGCIQGASAMTTPTNEGTWPIPLPASVHIASPTPGYFVVKMVEHNAPIIATTGTGGTGTTYVENINWTAPAAGTGTVSLWTALNAVNNDDHNSGDLWNKTHISIAEWSSVSGISNAGSGVVQLHTWPNPAMNILQVNAGTLPEGSYQLNVFSVNGQCRYRQEFEADGQPVQKSLDLSDWSPGLYLVEISNGTLQLQSTIVKQ